MSELLHVLQQSQSISDTSDVEQGIMATETVTRPMRKRKWEVTTEHSGSGNSSCSSPSIPWKIGYLGFMRKGSESNDENGDASEVDGYVKSIKVMKGYDTATTAVVTDSEDDLFFLEENRFVVEDQFALEYEPPATDDGEDDGDESDDEESLSLHTSDDNEDPGAEGGDEFEDEDDTDSEIDEDEMWSCLSCSFKNHPMTRHCTGCWERRCEWLSPGLARSSSAPVPQQRGIDATNRSLFRSNSLCTSPTIETVRTLGGKSTCTCPICMAVNFVPPVADKKLETIPVNSSGYVGAYNSNNISASQLMKHGQFVQTQGIDVRPLVEKDSKESVGSSVDVSFRAVNVDGRGFSKDDETKTNNLHVEHTQVSEAAKFAASSEVSSSSVLTMSNSSSELVPLSSQKDLTESRQLDSSSVSPQTEIQHSMGTVWKYTGFRVIDADIDSADTGAENRLQNENNFRTSAEKSHTEQQQTTKAVYQNKGQTDVCIICLSQPRNASFVHGHTGHQVCCIECAEKMKATKKRCPVCRKKIQLVVKNFL